MPTVMYLVPEIYPELSAPAERSLDEALKRYGDFLEAATAI